MKTQNIEALIFFVCLMGVVFMTGNVLSQTGQVKTLVQEVLK